MLYLDFARNKEDFILEKEEKYPYWIQKIIRFFRRTLGQPFCYELEGKTVVLISKWNKRIAKKMNKIFNINVTKTVCVCEPLRQKKEFMNYLREKKLQIVDGKWLFRFLVCDIAEFICKKNNLVKEEQEISILVQEPDFLVFETIKKLGKLYKNITIITSKIRKFNRISKEIYEEMGLAINVTNNFKNACLKSKIIFNFDFDDKDINKIRFLVDSNIICLKEKNDIKQSTFRGHIYDYYCVNLPIKYHKIYKRLNCFDSSILYESLIYKHTSNENIWKEIVNDNVKIVAFN